MGLEQSQQSRWHMTIENDHVRANGCGHSQAPAGIVSPHHQRSQAPPPIGFELRLRCIQAHHHNHGSLPGQRVHAPHSFVDVF
jgi:hypothetical protein